MIKNKNILMLTTFSFAACVLHAVILQTPLNAYLYSSAFKVIIFILCPILYFKISKDGSMKELLSLFLMRDEKNVKLSFALGVCVFALIVAVFMLVQPFIDRTIVIEALAENGITYDNVIFAFIYIVLINAALEQLFFRGFVFMTLYNRAFKRYAHAYSSVLFSAYHIPIIINGVSIGILLLCTIGLVAAGLIFNALAVKCKSISGSLIVHISANLALNMMIGTHFVFA